MEGKVWLYSGSILAVLVIAAWLGPWLRQVSRDWVELQRTPSAQVTEKMKFDASLAITQAIVSGIGTAATIGGGIVLFLNFRVANENLKVANRNAEIANKNAELTESRLITERFSKAVEQLGNDKSAEVRLGGIYSLERLAKDSQADHWTVMEVLTTFVREKSSQLDEKKERRNPHYDAEIQAILTVLGRRNHIDSEAFPLDLSQSNLSGFTLKGNFQGTNFRDTNLCGARLEEAKFNEVKFAADFTYANLINANCKKADFSGACLEGAFLYSADFTEARLVDTKLEKARFRAAVFVKADFKDATLENAYFWDYIEWYQRHWTDDTWLVFEHIESLNDGEIDFEELQNDPIFALQAPDFRNTKNLIADQAKSACEWEKGIYDEHLRKALCLPDPEPDESE